MESSSWLWRDLHDLFDTEDGSLPEIRVNYVDTEAVPRGYALLRSLARTVSTTSTFCRIDGEEENHHVDSVPNPASLVVAEEAYPFHVLMEGIEIEGTTLPDIGVGVFHDNLALDYYMGKEWGPARLEAFFALLSQLADLDPQSSLLAEDQIEDDADARFQSAWSRYRTQAS